MRLSGGAEITNNRDIRNEKSRGNGAESGHVFFFLRRNLERATGEMEEKERHRQNGAGILHQ